MAFRWTACPRPTDDVGALISALARSSFDPVVPDVPFVAARSCYRRSPWGHRREERHGMRRRQVRREVQLQDDPVWGWMAAELRRFVQLRSNLCCGPFVPR